MRPRPPRVLCIGSFVMDRVTTPTGIRPDHPGGNAIIVSCAIARAGIVVSLAGTTADDPCARSIKGCLQRHGVDTSLLGIIAGSTKIVDIRLDGDGNWTPMGATRGHPYLSEPVPSEVLAGFTHLQVAGLQSMIRACLDPTRTTVRWAREAGLTVGFGFNRFDTSERGIVEELVEPDDLVFASAAEYATWREADATVDLGRSPQRNVVVTLGSKGAWVWEKGHDPVRLPTREVHAISSIGAGDLLSGTAVAGWLLGEPLILAVSLGQEVAAASLPYPTWDGMWGG